MLLAIDGVQPANYETVEEGKSIDIECDKAEIINGGNVTWSKGEKKDLKLRQRFTVNDNGSLHIREIKKADIGFYTCASTTEKDRKHWTYFVNMYLNVKYKYKCFWKAIKIFWKVQIWGLPHFLGWGQ